MYNRVERLKNMIIYKSLIKLLDVEVIGVCEL